MAGVVEIKAGDKTHTLRFNVFGCAAFQDKLASREKTTAAQASVDLVYGGLIGNATSLGLQEPDYQFAVELFEAISEQEDYDDIQQQIDAAFRESKFGNRFKVALDKAVKDAEELEKKSLKKKS